jgi:hypothetical protein
MEHLQYFHHTLTAVGICTQRTVVAIEAVKLGVRLKTVVKIKRLAIFGILSLTSAATL